MLDPDEVAKVAQCFRLCRVSGGAGSGQAHAASSAWRHLLHRRLGKRKGPRPVGAVCHGQVCAAGSLAQSMARELSPHGIHIGHVVIDGGIESERRPNPPDKPDSMLDPDAIAESYLHLLQQPRSAWSWENPSCGHGSRNSKGPKILLP